MKIKALSNGFNTFLVVCAGLLLIASDAFAYDLSQIQEAGVLCQRKAKTNATRRYNRVRFFAGRTECPNAANWKLVYRTDDIASLTATVVGPTGAPGDQGPQGEQGPMGPQGETGPMGPQGIQGIQGEVGPQGETGPQGEQGLQGIQGVQGEVGPQGETGPQGIQGEQGPQGDQGIQGIQGIQGVQGEMGPQGDQGIQGEVGPQGDMGPQGDQGIQGEVGPQGDMGPQGEQGPQGVQGETGTVNPFACTMVAGVPEEARTETSATSVALCPAGYFMMTYGWNLDPNSTRYTREAVLIPHDSGNFAMGVAVTGSDFGLFPDVEVSVNAVCCPFPVVD